MSPTARYQYFLTQGSIQPDAYQQQIVEKLQTLYDTIMQHRSWWRWLTPVIGRGIYLWGEVGVGKTFLMDIFYDCLPEPKARWHFHRFMALIHEELSQLKKTKNPLTQVAKQLAKKTRVICLDEFIVNDIADAMLLAGLLQALFIENIYFFTTANAPPDNLYLKGLQRDQFLPAIELLNQHLEVIHLPSHLDYRQQEQTISHGSYFSPSDHAAKVQLKKLFSQFGGEGNYHREPLQVLGRLIAVKMRADSVVWFDFMAICGIPRSQLDYLAIATQYHTVLLSDMPQLLPDHHNLVRAFINLVDILYDYKVRLIIAAAVSLEKLYESGKLITEFARTHSRLVEMQSVAWFSMERKTKE